MEEVESRLFSPVDIFQFSMSCRVHSKSSRSKQKRVVAEDHSDAAGVYGIFKVLEPVNPAIIVSENVKEAKDSATYVILKSVLSELGYNVHEFLLDQQQSGSFENRTRYWFVAIDKNLPEIVPEAIPRYARQFHTFQELASAAPANDHVWRTPSAVRIEKIARDKQKGNGFSNQEMLYPESTSAPCIRSDYTKDGSTDVKVAGKDGTYRMLTPHEHCLMKSAPFSLIDGLSKTLAHVVLGQGVDMGQSIGLAELICLCVTGKVKAQKSLLQLVKPLELPEQALLF
jgi:DNA (cytosine-5)-methyltransferase 1